MALRKKQPDTGTTRMTGVEVTQGRTPRPSLAENVQFQYWVDPTAVTIRGGVARYRPIRVDIRNGVQGVLGGDPATMDSYQKQNGRILVPGDFPTVAWGVKGKGYMERVDLGEDRGGKQLWHYRDVWTRYEQVGATTVTSFDHDGWHQFCEDVAKLVGSEPHEAIVEAERSRLRAAAATHRSISHASPGSAAVAAELEERIRPQEGTPPT